MAGNKATLGSGPDIARLVGRRSRLKLALASAEGDRKTSLADELDTVTAQIVAMREQLNVALAEDEGEEQVITSDDVAKLKV